MNDIVNASQTKHIHSGAQARLSTWPPLKSLADKLINIDSILIIAYAHEINETTTEQHQINRYGQKNRTTKKPITECDLFVSVILRASFGHSLLFVHHHNDTIISILHTFSAFELHLDQKKAVFGV